MEKTSIYKFGRERLRPCVAIPSFIFLAALTGFIKDRHGLFGFPLDDAWIHCVYSRSFAFGHGFAYNDGRQEAGSTSPLWVILTAPAQWLAGFGTHWATIAIKTIGALLGLATILATERIAKLLTGSSLVAGIAASLMALEPRLLFSSLSGMETLLLVAIWAWAYVMLLNGRFVLFLILLGLAPLARPEALLLLPLSLLAAGNVLHWHRAIGLKWCVFLLPLLPQLLWSAACLEMNGHLLPNTFYIKAQSLNLASTRIQLAWLGLTQHGFPSLWIFVPGIAATMVFGLAKRTREVAHGGLMLIVMPLIYLWSVVATSRFSLEGYYWTRWLDPASLMLTMAFCIGFALLLTMMQRHKRNPAYILVSGLSLVALLIFIPGFANTFAERRDYLSFHSRRIDTVNVQMGKWIAANVPQRAVVAVNDAGAIRYFGNRQTIDLLGLNSAKIAFKKAPPLNEMARADWLAIFPNWFEKSNAAQQILKQFEARFATRFEDEPGQQTVKVAYQKKAAKP